MNLKPTQRLQDLIKKIGAKELVDNRYIFTLIDHTPEDAKKYVHRVRVELSRVRALIVESGKQKRRFKILLEGVEAIGKDCKVTLRYKDSDFVEINEQLAAIMSQLTTGEALPPRQPVSQKPTVIPHTGVRLHVKVD